MPSATLRSLGRLPFRAPSVRGNVMDLVFVLLSLAGLGALSRGFMALLRDAMGDDPAAGRNLAIVMGTVALLRLGGLYLKRIPLQRRRAGGASDAALGCLPLLNFGLVALMVAVAGAPLLELLGRREAEGRGSGAPLAIAFAVGGLAFIGLEWVLFVRAVQPSAGGASRRRSPGGGSGLARLAGGRGVELLADVGLGAYILLWQMFYQAWLDSIPPWHGNAELLARFGRLPFSLVMFALLYLAPRLIYLVEDAPYRATWGTLALVWLVGAARLFR